MPHRIINLNAGSDYDSDEFEQVKNWVIIERGLGSASKPLKWLEPIYDRVPVFLVDAPLMDELYPPWKWAVVSENCLKESLEKYFQSLEEDSYDLQRKIPDREEQFEELGSLESEDEGSEEYDLSDLEEGEWPSDLWGAWRHCTSRRYRKSYAPAAGVYLSQLSKSQLEAIQSHKGGGGQRSLFDENVLENTFLNLPRIFICPDRVRINDPTRYRLRFAKVFFHELAHALMDRLGSAHHRCRYRLPWGRVIEESLANAIAFDALRSAKDINCLHGYIDRQPLVYQGYRYFLNLKRSIGDTAHCLTFSKNLQVSERKNDCLIAERRILYGLAEAWESNIPFSQFTDPFCFSNSGTHSQRLSQFLNQDGTSYANTYWKVLGAEIIAHIYGVRWRK